MLSDLVVTGIDFDAWIATWKIILHVANVGLLIYLFFISAFEDPYARRFRRATE